MPDLERVRWLGAITCVVWFVGFSWSEPRATLLAAPLVLVGVLLLPRQTRAGTGLVLAAGALTFVAGVSWGILDLVLPFSVALFALGRGREGWAHGLTAVGLAAGVSAVRDGFALEKVAVTLALYGTVWAFGLVVRRRTARAHAAVTRAAILARQDPRATGARLAVEERGRLAAHAVFSLRSAIVGMQTTARRAVPSLDDALVREVHERGAVAVDELRELLGLLREVPQHPATATAAAVEPSSTTRRSAAIGPIACLTLAAASVVVAIDPPRVPEGLLPGAAAYAFAAWAVAARPSRAAWASLGALVVAGVWLSTAYGPLGAGFVLFVVGASVLAGLAWSEGDRVLQQAQQRTGKLQAELADATAAALRTERLRLARELHDVASHSVGAMVLQAGAASAQRARDSDRARSALRTVIATGDSALREVDKLLETLDAGELGFTFTEPGALRAAIESLVAAMRDDGMTVTMSLDALPASPAMTATTYRIVHEGLVNARRHAPGRSVTIATAHEAGRYVVRVSNTRSEPSCAPSAGFGIAGLRERVLACEGTFTAGPAAEGAFVIEARLPLEAAAVGRGQA